MAERGGCFGADNSEGVLLSLGQKRDPRRRFFRQSGPKKSEPLAGNAYRAFLDCVSGAPWPLCHRPLPSLQPLNHQQLPGLISQFLPKFWMCNPYQCLHFFEMCIRDRAPSIPSFIGSLLFLYSVLSPSPFQDGKPSDSAVLSLVFSQIPRRSSPPLRMAGFPGRLPLLPPA